MARLDYRFGIFAILCGTASGFLALVDLFETPKIFENGRVELVLAFPLAIWLAARFFSHEPSDAS